MSDLILVPLPLMTLMTKEGKKVNSCKVKDLDLERMRQSAARRAGRYYNEEIKRAKKAGDKPFFWNYKEIPTKEQYMKDADIPQTPYAVLHDGDWIARGEMGYFGIDDPNCAVEEWDKQFEEWVKSLDPETLLTVVDCHI